MSRSPAEELALSDLDRSNKGASKQRRDLINAEIAIMRDLLPLSESARQRLSQLQVMSLSCVFIRKCNVLGQLFSSLPAESDMPTMCDFSQALSGFLLVTTREGKLVFISENVTDYLGHSMVDMKTQGDSLFDIVDKRDEANVRAHLLQAGGAVVGAVTGTTEAEPDLSGKDVSFFCRMNMSRTLKRQSAFGDVKVMHVRGHFLPLSDPSPSDGAPHHHHSQQQQQQQQQKRKYVFMATCSPLIMPELKESLIQSNTMVFKTVHSMDMTFLEVTKTAEFHLGCSTEEICKASWYSMLHPEDIHEAREKHVLLMRASHELGCMMTVRMLTRKGEVMWVNVVMQVRQSAAAPVANSSSSSSAQSSEDGVIVCINQVISEAEAMQLRLQSPTFTLYPPRTTELWNSTATMMMPSSQQQPDAICWRPASSSSSSSTVSPLHHPSLSPPMALMGSCSSLAQQQRQPPTPVGYVSGLGQTAYRHIPSASPQSSSSPSSCSASTAAAMLPSSSSPVPHHTDKLKLMLKRKLQQGPPLSQPAAKMPRIAAFDESSHARSNSSAGQCFERAAAATAGAGALPLKMGGVALPEGFSWSGPSQGMPQQQGQYQMVFPSSSSVGQNVKASTMLVPSSRGRGSLSPQQVTAATYQGTEQVVPQSEPRVAVIAAPIPESYLTPDSSPASSPDPQTSSNMKNRAAPVSAVTATTAAVLKDLEKLPVFLKAKSSTTAAVAVTVAGVTDAAGLRIKTEKRSTEGCGHAGHRRELPVMDASDIESFFHTLDCSKQFTAVEREEEQQQSQTPLPEVPTHVEENQAAFKAAARAAVTEQAPYVKIKQEPVAGPFSSSAAGQQRQAQAVVKNAKEQPSPAQQSDELEAILGFFAGEMTATQLNLEGVLDSSLIKEEGERGGEEAGELWLSDSKQGWARQGGQVCSAGQLDPFLLHGSPLDRPHEGFSPVSPSDVSGDEDGSNSNSGEDTMDKPLASLMTAERGEGKKRGCGIPSPSSGSFPSPSPATPLYHFPQTSPEGLVPAMEEEDELYQLDKLLSLMASDSGVVLFPDSQ